MRRRGQTEFVRTRENVSGRLRPCVEALQLELVAQAAANAEVDAFVVGFAFAVPDAEVSELREAPRLTGVDASVAVDVHLRIPTEAERNVAILDAHQVKSHAHAIRQLRRETDGRLSRLRRRDRRRSNLV